jgi:hypothetical protein
MYMWGSMLLSINLVDLAGNLDQVSVRELARNKLNPTFRPARSNVSSLGLASCAVIVVRVAVSKARSPRHVDEPISSRIVEALIFCNSLFFFSFAHTNRNCLESLYV